MAERYRFFDTVNEDKRLYTAQAFAEYFSALIKGGVFGEQLNSLQVTGHGSQMATVVATGRAFIDGYFYENDASLQLQHELPHATLARIDRVVLRLDKRLEARFIKAFVLTGTPAASPAAPALTRNADVYEISLARVAIPAAKSFIETSQVTDERGDESLCGYVSYQAKPAWYPQESVCRDVWMYAHFKQLLTAQEQADVENNPSMMYQVARSAVYWEDVFKAQKVLRRYYRNLDRTISGTETIGTTPQERIQIYNNLAIPAGATLQLGLQAGVMLVVLGTLTLNGTISGVGRGPAGPAGQWGSGAGGNAGGAITIIAREIVGTGTIDMSGTNGQSVNPNNGNGWTNNDGGPSGTIYGEVCQGGLSSTSTDATTGRNAIIRKINGIFFGNWFTFLDTGAGAGGKGMSTDGTSTNCHAGGGGAGAGGIGGKAGWGSSGSYKASGGGGGGGGFIGIVSDKPIPALTLRAKGGNAGTGWATGGNGGGGLIYLIAPSTSATTDVAQGSTAGGTAGGAGQVVFEAL
ncbi:MAG: hypothetical protein ACOY9Y_09700 [Bacillota bacterium]